MFMFGSDFISEIEKLSSNDYRVLFRLLSHLEFQNWINVTQTSIANATKLSSLQ